MKTWVYSAVPHPTQAWDSGAEVFMELWEEAPFPKTQYSQHLRQRPGKLQLQNHLCRIMGST